jgi:hypothetical protein
MNSIQRNTSAGWWAAFIVVLSVWLLLCGCANPQLPLGNGQSMDLSERVTFYSVPFR